MEAQRRAVASACVTSGWELVDVLEDVASARTTNGRRGLAEALERLARHEADALVVAKLDRLARSTLDFAAVMERAQSEGWALVILDPELDLGSPFGCAMAGVIAVFAQLEREMISQRVSEALATAAANGVRLGRPRVASDDTARLIARERRRGATWEALARRLNAWGIPTPTREGRWWPASARSALIAARRDGVPGTEEET
jgi:DNA invertase Pin-like site-specific DNA recombinase